MSYIVRNCMCAYGFVNEPMYCLWKDEVPIHKTLCQNCTDCVIKQVIEKCKTIIEKDYREKDRHLFSEDDLKILDRTRFDVGMGCKKTARQILQLFNIEETNK